MLLAGACKKSLCAKTAILPPSNKKFYLLTALIIIIIKAIFVSPAYAATPSVGTISPSYGSSPADTAITFTATYSDPSGWAHIQLSYLLINTSITGSNCFWGYYNQNNNKLYIRDDAGKKWLGGYSPGSSNIIENSYAKLDCSKTIISGSGNTLTVKWNVTFKSTFVGTQTKNLYLYVQDDSNLSAGWTQKGTYLVGTNSTPAVGTISPSSGSGLPDTAITFTATYTDPNGFGDIRYVYLLINTSITGSNCFWGYYNQNNNKLYIRDDAGKKWLGGYSPGTSNTIENSYAKLDCSKTIISGSGNTLTVKWNVTFKDTFLGQKKSYLYVQDDSNLSASWTQKGAWKIYLNQRLTNITPPSGSILYIDQVNTIDADAENYVSNTTLKYRFWLGTTLLQDWTTNDKYSWTPVSSNIGTCNIKVEVGINHTVGHSKTLGYCIARKPILAE